MTTRLSGAWARIAASLMVLAVLAGCNSESELGADFVPVGQITVVSPTRAEFKQLRDTVMTTGLPDEVSQFRFQGAPYLLGNYDDPHLGRVRASVFAQFNFDGRYQSFGQTSFDTTLGVNIQVDSVVLNLSINTVYGRGIDPQVLRVRMVRGLIRFPGTSPNQRLFNENDSIAVDGSSTDYASAHVFSFAENERSLRLRLRLSNALGDSLLNTSLRAMSGCIDTLYNRSVFRGLHFSTDPVVRVPGQFRGAIYTLGAQSSSPIGCFPLPGLDSMNVNVYFRSRDSNTAPDDTIQRRRIVFALYPRSNVGFSRVTRFVYSGSVLDSVLRQPRQRNLVLTGGSGYKLRIRLPNLRDSLPRGIVNTASLLLKVDPAFMPTGPDSLRFVPPSILNLVQSGTDSLSENNLQQPLQALYSPVQRGYVVPIGTYASVILAGGSDRGVILYVSDRSRRASRVVLAGPDHPDPALRPRLTVFYTPLPR